MSWSVEQHNEFAVLAEAVLRRSVPGFAALDGKSHDESLELWTMSLWAFKPEIESVDVGAAVGQLEAYVKLLIPWDMEKRVTVHAKIGRNYGPEYIEFGLSDQAQPGQASQKAAFDRLIKTVLSEHDDYSARHLPNTSAQGSAQRNSGNENGRPSPGGELFEDTTDHLDVSVKDGRVGYSVKCGRWQKFGVRVFPEVLKAAGIDVDTIPIQGLDIPGAQLTYSMKPDGQYPDKVIKLKLA